MEETLKEAWENGKGEPRIILESQLQRVDKPICFDIETYKWTEKQLLIDEIVKKAGESYVKPDVIKKYQDQALEKLALDPLTGQVIVGGFYDGEKDFYHHIISDGNESITVKQIFEELVKYLANGYRLITKGGKRFDLPYLLTRAGILGVKIDFPYNFSELINKYKTFYHLDLENIFEKHSLGTIGYAFGLINEPGNKGGEIGGMWEKQDYEGIQQKNSEDLKITYEIYQRIKWLNL